MRHIYWADFILFVYIFIDIINAIVFTDNF